MARRTVSEHHAKLIANTAAYEAGMARAVAATKAAEGRIAASGRGMRGVFQNTGYQVQDFAVQVAGGTSALRAFGQQAPQLLGSFGPAGAIAGAAVSVGVLIAQIAMASKGNKDFALTSEQAAESTKKLADAIERVAQARARVNEAAGSLVSSEISRSSLDNQLALSDDREGFLRGEMERLRNLSFVRAGQSTSESRPAEERARLALEAKDLEAEAARYQALVLEQTQRRKDLVDQIAKIERESVDQQIKMRQKAERDAFDFSEKLNASIKKVSDSLGSDVGLSVTSDSARKILPEIPVDSYQRRGLSLDANGGAGAAMQKQEQQVDLLKSIDSTLKAARRSGIITWQTN